jgi:hypothetical protein
MNQEQQDPSVGAGHSDTNLLRRRLLRGGLAGAPVLLSLSSRSVMACHSTTPSAFGSISASRPDVLVALSGQPPSYWCDSNCYSQWPSPYFPTTRSGSGGHTATKFNSIFSNSPFSSTTTLLDVLKKTGSSTNLVASCIVAALLNGASGRTSAVLNVSQVKSMWNEFITKGYFEPTAGVKWYAQSPVTAMMTAGGGGITGYLYTTWT